ncbi:O-antigen ligase family protein [candidate division WOR-3 bacterium]|nr:O-antigen ligase family protein [candidate division WOR-3 bacterium]
MTDILKKKYTLMVVGALEILLVLLLTFFADFTPYTKKIILIAMGIPLIFLFLNRPWLFIYLIPLSAFLSYSLTIKGIKINATHACIFCLCFPAILFILYKKQNYFKDSLFWKPILIISIVSLISFLFTLIRDISSSWVMRGTLEVIFFLLLYQACIILIDSDKKIKYLMFSLIAAGTLISFQTLLGFSQALRFSPEKMAQTFFFIRGGSFGASPNQAAIFIELIIPIVLIHYLYAKKRSWKLLSLSILFIMFLAIFSTFSRGAILGLGITTILIIFLTKKTKEALIPFALIIIFLFASSFYLLVMARLETIAFQATTFAGRIPLFKVALNVIKQNWFIGIGMNNFQFLKYSYGLPYSYDPYKIQSAHNIYLEMFANLGIMGFIVTIWIFIASITSLTRTSKSNEQIKANSIGLFGSITTFYIHGFIDCAIANIRTMAVFIIILSLLAIEYSRNKWR